MANRIPLIVNPAASQIQEFNESTDSLLGAIPIGGIIMWSGKIADIPTNYALCNGSNGTPNLTNKFIIGAVSDQNVSGITTAATTITGSNAKDGGTKDAVIVSHRHAPTTSASGSSNNLSSQAEGSSIAVNDQVVGNYGGGSGTGLGPLGNRHFMENEGVSGTNKNLPPFFALAYIMRTT
tara:strand:- start:50 stop:589 length:540 start_codon:yes stop_codon:yes gene_type:complete